MPSTSVPPPDFRYVGLEPAPSRGELRARAAASGAALFGVGILAGGGAEPLTVAGASLVGVGTALFVLRKSATCAAPALGVEYIALVPWGVLIHSPSEPRVWRWGALESVEVRYVHEMDDATPLVKWSVVTLASRRETLVGRAPGYVALDRLEAHLPAYRKEAARAIALDAAGAEVALSDIEPVFSRLLDYARRVVRSPAVLGELGLRCPGYRGGHARPLGADALAVIERWISEPDDTNADKRPLAALLAAELRASTLVDRLLPMVTSPHPFVAAVARAAALKMGADLRRVGALSELSEFIAEPELEAMERWGLGA